MGSTQAIGSALGMGPARAMGSEQAMWRAHGHAIGASHRIVTSAMRSAQAAALATSCQRHSDHASPRMTNASLRAPPPPSHMGVDRSGGQRLIVAARGRHVQRRQPAHVRLGLPARRRTPTPGQIAHRPAHKARRGSALHGALLLHWADVNEIWKFPNLCN